MGPALRAEAGQLEPMTADGEAGLLAGGPGQRRDGASLELYRAPAALAGDVVPVRGEGGDERGAAVGMVEPLHESERFEQLEGAVDGDLPQPGMDRAAPGQQVGACGPIRGRAQGLHHRPPGPGVRAARAGKTGEHLGSPFPGSRGANRPANRSANRSANLKIFFIFHEPKIPCRHSNRQHAGRPDRQAP